MIVVHSTHIYVYLKSRVNYLLVINVGKEKVNNINVEKRVVDVFAKLNNLWYPLI